MGQGGRVSDKGRGAGTCLHPGISRPCFGVLSPVARARLRHVTQCKAGFSQSMDSFFQRLNVLTLAAVLPPGRAPRRKEIRHGGAKHIPSYFWKVKQVHLARHK